MRATIVAGLAALAFATLVAASSGGTKAPSCPAAWQGGWQKLANRLDAPVYCPTWMPNPLDGKIGGDWQDIYSTGKDRSYLVSFLSHGEGGSGDVHVNFRGYPGRTRIPLCATLITVERKKPLRGTTPCFANASGTRRVPGIVATVYTVNQDADQWHVLLAWRHQGSLYAVSEHVIKPYTYRQVVANLDRLLKSLVLVRPAR
ncbi:MAG TPA: hypothetical protein VGJ25_09580 [Gaiellaceae bacterium]